MFSPWTDLDTHAVVMWVFFFVLLWTTAKLLSWTVFRRGKGVRNKRERILKPAARADNGLEWTKVEIPTPPTGDK